VAIPVENRCELVLWLLYLWLFNPVLFAFRGPVEAGRMGMSLSLANAIQAIAVSWVGTKSAPFGTLVARKEFDRLDQVFFQALRQSVAVSILGL